MTGKYFAQNKQWVTLKNKHFFEEVLLKLTNANSIKAYFDFIIVSI